MTKPEKAQLIHPPIRIMGRTLVRFPFIMSVSMLVSATEPGQQNRVGSQQQSRVRSNGATHLSWGS